MAVGKGIVFKFGEAMWAEGLSGFSEVSEASPGPRRGVGRQNELEKCQH